MTTLPLLLRFSLDKVPELANRYAHGPDIPVIAIGRAARSRGYFTRAEFIEVCEWKTVRSKSRVTKNDEDAIVEATRLALSVRNEALRIGIPMLLHGVSWGTSSVLLHLAHRDPYPIIDYRALDALGVPRGSVNYTVSFWIAYVKTCRELARVAGVDMRTLDRAMWQWSADGGG